jgi:hypothetical protein
MEHIVGEIVGGKRWRPFMTGHQTESRTGRTATQARAGVTGHNVRYVLAASLMSVIIFFAGLLYYWAA